MCFGKIFLAIAWIVSFEATCSVCCDYNPECLGWTSQANCTYSGNCIWTGSACRWPVCSDISGSQSDCEDEGCIYTTSTSTCREATSCSDFSQAICDYGVWLNEDVECAWVGGACKAPSCADFNTIGDCENSHTGINNGYCIYKSGPTATCTLTTSCSDWNSKLSECTNKYFDGRQCFSDGSVCKIPTCADFTSSDCETPYPINGIGYCRFDGSVCSPATCSSWTANGSTVCSSRSEDSVSCFFDTTTTPNVCRRQKCEDISSTTNCYSYQGCVVSGGVCTTASSCSAWNNQQTNCYQAQIGDDGCVWENGDSTCNPSRSCASLTSQSECEANYCRFVDVCPVRDPPSHAIFMRVSSLLVVLLLAFLL